MDYPFSLVLAPVGWFSFDFLLFDLSVLWAENKRFCEIQTLKTFVVHYLQIWQKHQWVKNKPNG